MRQVLERAIGEVWVEGEVSNYRKQPSGHQYFTLKDANAQLQCVQFARAGAWRRTVALSNGMQVQARGTLTVYEARGQYQMNVQLIQASGAGLLQAKFEALKRRLEAEGLFDPERKRALPPFPTSVAIVTSASGAALRDMLHIFARRAPWMRIVVQPTRVQGEGAAEEIAAGIEEANAYAELGLPPVDLIIVARGGGSIEDLWEFNEERVARAIFASRLPVISAVGHEIDFTIADFVADLRAPTPSAAAELAAPDRGELQRRLEQMRGRMRRCVETCWQRFAGRLSAAVRRGSFREPERRLQAAAQRLDTLAEEMRWLSCERISGARKRLASLVAILRLHRPDQKLAIKRREIVTIQSRLAQAFAMHREKNRRRLEAAAGLLRLVSPQATLERGYTLTTNVAGELLTSSAVVHPRDRIVTRFADGLVESEVRDQNGSGKTQR